jgi:nucleolar GTP-binding protein
VFQLVSAPHRHPPLPTPSRLSPNNNRLTTTHTLFQQSSTATRCIASFSTSIEEAQTKDLEEDITTEQQQQKHQQQSITLDPAPLPKHIGAEASNINVNTTGAFYQLPMVAPGKEIMESAFKRASRVPANNKLKNEAQKAKNKAARQLDTLTKELCVPLTSYIKGFPAPHRLHPFERALMELTLQPGVYEKVLRNVDAVRRSTLEVGKAYATRASRAANKREAIALQEEGFARMETVFSKGSDAVDRLKEVARNLRKLPVVRPELPTMALVGAPNVGKSSLVQLLSTGLPDIQDYPFTTRSIKMGHFYVNGRRHQVTDTPGLLNRPDDDRNAMERLTLASLEYLPTAVLFVTDLTGHCGTSPADQWRIRGELKGRFEGKSWVDVFSKADLLTDVFEQAAELAITTTWKKGNGNRNEREVCSAVEYAAMLEGEAHKVSSLTGDGIDELKVAMIEAIKPIAAHIQGDGDDVKEEEEE